MKVLVIIPAYNEEASICEVVSKLKADYPSADYLIVNDCSKDRTKEILAVNRFNFVNLPINLGIGGGVQTGYQYARDNGYDIAVQIDGDGQHDTAFLKNILDPLQQDQADIVIGSRFITNEGFQSSAARRTGIFVLSALIKICCGIKIKDVTSGFRAVNRRYIEMYASDYPSDYPEPKAIVQAAVDGAHILEIPVVMKERMGGVSSIHAWKSVYYMIKVSLDIILCRISNRRRKL